MGIIWLTRNKVVTNFTGLYLQKELFLVRFEYSLKWPDEMCINIHIDAAVFL